MEEIYSNYEIHKNILSRRKLTQEEIEEYKFLIKEIEEEKNRLR
jgi:hypothetical protein